MSQSFTVDVGQSVTLGLGGLEDSAGNPITSDQLVPNSSSWSLAGGGLEFVNIPTADEAVYTATAVGVATVTVTATTVDGVTVTGIAVFSVETGDPATTVEIVVVSTTPLG